MHPQPPLILAPCGVEVSLTLPISFRYISLIFSHMHFHSHADSHSRKTRVQRNSRTMSVDNQESERGTKRKKRKVSDRRKKKKIREWDLGRNRKQTKREGGNMKWVRQKAQLSNKKRDTNTEGARARERERQAEREELESERKKPKERHLLHDIAKDRFCWAILHSSSCKNSVIEDK